jgi:hypothetical protein
LCSVCWPRPAWYTWRRLAWLLSLANASLPLATNLRVVWNLRGLTVIELTFARLVGTGPDGVALQSGWTRAYLLWLDQYCDDPAYYPRPWTTNAVAHFRFDDAQQARFPAELPGYEPFSMVPEVSAPVGATNPRGYAEPAAVSWTWGGWDDALVRADTPVDYVLADPHSSIRVPRWRLELEVQKSAPSSASATGGVAQAPVCLYTNGMFTHAD